MVYAHRYYYLLGWMIVIMSVGYVFDVRDLMAQRAKILADIEQIKFKISAVQRERMAAALRSQQLDEAPIADGFSQFLRVARTYHLEILSAVSARSDADSLVPAEEYQVVLRGNYPDLYRFFGGASITEIKNMVMSPELQQRARVEMRLRVSDEISAEDVSSADVINPFCGAEKPHAAHVFLREDMHVLGTVVRDGRRYGIELSPNGMMREVGESIEGSSLRGGQGPTKQSSH